MLLTSIYLRNFFYTSIFALLFCFSVNATQAESRKDFITSVEYSENLIRAGKLTEALNNNKLILRNPQYSNQDKDIISLVRSLNGFILLSLNNFDGVYQAFTVDINTTDSDRSKPDIAEWLNDSIDNYERTIDFWTWEVGDEICIPRVDYLIKVHELAISKFYKTGDSLDLHESLIGLLEHKAGSYRARNDIASELISQQLIIDKFKSFENDERLNVYIDRAIAYKGRILRKQKKPYYELVRKSSNLRTASYNRIDDLLDTIDKFAAIDQASKKSFGCPSN